MDGEIYFIKLATRTFDDVTDVKSAKKTRYLTVTPTAIELLHLADFYVAIMS